MYGSEMKWERFWYEEESQGVTWTRGHGKGRGKATVGKEEEMTSFFEIFSFLKVGR
jgi:hypothetical protein